MGKRITREAYKNMQKEGICVVRGYLQKNVNTYQNIIMGRARDVLNKRIQSEEQRVESRVVKEREREREREREILLFLY